MTQLYDSLVLNAERPTMDTIQTISFPPPDIPIRNITAPSIEIPEDTIRFIFNEQGGQWYLILYLCYNCTIVGNLAIVSFIAVNFDRRLPTDEG